MLGDYPVAGFLEHIHQPSEAKRKQGRSNKRKGPRNELRAMRYYAAQGCYCVRSGGSLGLFDVLAFCDERAYFVQVKSNRWPESKEMLALSQFVAPPYARKIVLRWDDYCREPKIREIP